MTAQVLYNKWRPRRFADVVGQEAIVSTLSHAVAQGKIAHAYLLSGPRGTGKTSTARILAKAVNCQQPQEGEPCNSCLHCKAINEGRALDLIEIDAATHRLVNETQEILDKVLFMPAEAKYKVYIIDEVHMLSGASFNAFLKTLEEPPSHAIFVLCTTEAHKLPPTVISRCQRFDFRRISLEAITQRLAQVCQGEGFSTTPQTLHLIARSSSGSLRDACNILDQASISYSGSITFEALQELLGVSGDEQSLQFVGHLLRGEVREGLRLLNTLASQGYDLRAFHREVVECLRGLLLLHSGATDSLDLPENIQDGLKKLASSTPWDIVVKAIKLFAQVNLRSDTISTLPLELALLECAQPPSAEHPSVKEESRVPTPAREEASTASPQKPQISSLSSSTPTPAHTPGTAREAIPISANIPTVSEGQWEEFQRQLKHTKGKKFNLGSLLLDCRERYIQGDTLVLAFRNSSNLNRLKEETENPDSMIAINAALVKAFGTKYTLHLMVPTGDVDNKEPQGHLVRTALKMGAKILTEKEGNE